MHPSSFDWVALLALIVAIVSVVIAVFYSRQTLLLTEAHNKKTVEPVLSTIYEQKAEAKLPVVKNKKIEYQSLSVSLELKNCGFGPAVIRSFFFIIDNKSYSDIFELNANEIGRSNFDPTRSIKHIFRNEVIAPNERALVFQINFKEEKYFDEFNELAKKVSLVIMFETIYKEERVFNGHTLI